MKSENRFKLARTQYNQHGLQSVKTVSEATGITKSLIDDLESNVLKERGTSYIKVAILAKHYGVSADYLLGLRSSPYTDAGIANVCEYTGLSKAAVEKLHRYSEKNQYTARSDIISLLLEDGAAGLLLDLIANRITYFAQYRRAKNEGERHRDRMGREMVIDLDGIPIHVYKNTIVDSIIQQQAAIAIQCVSEVYMERFSDTPGSRRAEGKKITESERAIEREQILKEIKGEDE